MEISNDDITEIKRLLIELNENIRVLMNYKFSDKLKLLEEKVITMKKLEVRQVMNLLDISRNHALDLMERLAKRKPFFKFLKGSKELQIGARIIYIEKEVFEKDLENVQILIPNEGDEITVAEIAQISNLNLLLYVDYLKSLFQTIVNNFPEQFELLSESRIRRVSRCS